MGWTHIRTERWTPHEWPGSIGQQEQDERENAIHCLNMAARLGRIMLHELGITEATLDRFDRLLAKEPDTRLAARAGGQIAALRILVLTGAPGPEPEQKVEVSRR